MKNATKLLGASLALLAIGGMSPSDATAQTTQTAAINEPTAQELAGTWKGRWRHKDGSWTDRQTIEVTVFLSGDALKTDHKVIDRDGKPYGWWATVEIPAKGKVRMSAGTFSRVETYQFERDGSKCKMEGNYLFKGEDWGRVKLEKDCPKTQ